ncbi:MAG TPA: hypothetical protein VFV08_14615 [Puia sp.]|nr:hypothetical protein [Puia sp.]
MRKKYFLIAGLIWLVLIGFGLYFYNKPHTSTANERADVLIEAADLFSQYQQDENAANKKFLDKIILVKGKVADVEHGGKVISVQLEGNISGGGINCSLSPNENETKLPAKGSTVSIKGKCSGLLIDVNLVDCVIVK